MKILNLYGIKGVMETYYNEEKGEFIPVTNLKILDNHYLYSSPDHRDIVTIMRSCRLSKSVQGTLNKYSNSTLNGFKLRSLDDSYTRSNTDRLELLTQSNILSVTAKGISKGKGFQGCMKRYNFKGLGQTHGVHTAHRSRGGIASKGSQVWKGTRMPGRMGGKSVTVKGLKIVSMDLPNIFVRGSIPGSKGQLINLFFRIDDK